ncbi:hypothetical protein HPB47_024408 [Ixodes persulcatus]|uniref:Uncharacterized protein n=2 Tax=Ixodes persulcatus TaxID=34615 RepID=A0AC60PHN4_IXOPE|nr:hypothetical protein HPB47_004304 [Ixodes persulcatus]KAG0428621.1 hypothetical protein HPB47_024408 [Ixodes persulcatus]
MHPSKHKKGREARANTLNKMLQNKTPNSIAYTDAALVSAGEVVAVARNDQDTKQVTALHTTIGDEITIGEQVAIALVITQRPRYIITDSHDASRAYPCGLIRLEAHQILDTHQPSEGKRTISIIWTPCHTETEVKGNARALAREEADARAMVSGDEHPDQQPDPPTPLTPHKKVTTYYREQRRTPPPPHHTLDKGEQVKWSLLQTNTNPTLSRLNLLYLQLHSSPTCSNCQQDRGTIYHMVLACPKHPKLQDSARFQNHLNSWNWPSEPRTRKISASWLSR